MDAEGCPIEPTARLFDVSEKRCNRCGASRPLADFHRAGGTDDGHRGECIDCRAGERQRRHQATRPRALAQMRSYRLRNLAADLERSRRWREAHPEESRERVQRWKRANPERVADLNQRRRAQRLDQLVEHVDRLELLRRHDGICGICGRVVNPNDFHVDHRLPLVRGGEHSYANTQPAHPICNLRKAARAEGVPDAA